LASLFWSSWKPRPDRTSHVQGSTSSEADSEIEVQTDLDDSVFEKKSHARSLSTSSLAEKTSQNNLLSCRVSKSTEYLPGESGYGTKNTFNDTNQTDKSKSYPRKILKHGKKIIGGFMDRKTRPSGGSR
jgi:hypothetical protein